MYTDFSTENYNFSYRGHLLAQTEVYPELLGVPFERLDFTRHDEEKAQRFDKEEGIDREVKVKSHLHPGEGIRFMVQERFRDPQWREKKDITITLWNAASNLPSELYKMRAQIFLYGYYDSTANKFLEVVAFNVPAFMLAFISGKLEIKRSSYKNVRSDQPFMAVDFDELHRVGVVIYHKVWKEEI